MGDVAQQRQGCAADQRSAARPAAGHPAGAAQPAADPDNAGYRRITRVVILIVIVIVVVVVRIIDQPTTPGQ
jgi:hypothetical protein